MSPRFPNALKFMPAAVLGLAMMGVDGHDAPRENDVTVQWTTEDIRTAVQNCILLINTNRAVDIGNRPDGEPVRPGVLYRIADQQGDMRREAYFLLVPGTTEFVVYDEKHPSGARYAIVDGSIRFGSCAVKSGQLQWPDDMHTDRGNIYVGGERFGFSAHATLAPSDLLDYVDTLGNDPEPKALSVTGSIRTPVGIRMTFGSRLNSVRLIEKTEGDFLAEK